MEQKCFVIHKWNSATEIINIGPVFLEKQQAFEYIDKQEDPFEYSFKEFDLINNPSITSR